MTATVTLNPTELVDNVVWFANAAAWNQYWRNVEAEVTLDAIDTAVYVPSAYNSALLPYTFEIDGIVTAMATNSMLQSLITQVATLDASYKALRVELKAAGLITNAQ